MDSIFLKNYPFSGPTEKKLTFLSIFQKIRKIFLIFQNSWKELKVYKYQKTRFFQQKIGFLINGVYFLEKYLIYDPTEKKTGIS